MFELSVARKYLTPRWRQLSTSIISLISILVIALVVWLIVVFFSVTVGLEKSWISKLIALTAPMRVTPTEAYYRSYYYQVDSISSHSNYTPKTIGEKLKASKTDPYDPLSDEEPPALWPQPDLDAEGNLKDLTKLAFQSIDSLQNVPGLHARDFEMTMSTMRLQLLRQIVVANGQPSLNQASMGQTTYLGSFDADNPALAKTALPLTMEDLTNILTLSGVSTESLNDDPNEPLQRVPKDVLRSRLKTFFELVSIRELKTPSAFWDIPKDLYPAEAHFEGVGLFKKQRLVRILIPTEEKNRPAVIREWAKEGFDAIPLTLHFRDHKASTAIDGQGETPLSTRTPVAVAGQISLSAVLERDSLEKALSPGDVRFQAHFTLQGTIFPGSVPLESLSISQAEVIHSFAEMPERPPLWLYGLKQEHGHTRLVLPADPLIGDGILLPRTFREAGVLVGDRGYVSYMTPTASSVQEQRVPVFVAGFYDPGVIPIGGKYVLASQEITSLIRSSHNQEDTTLSNGINVRFDNLEQADQVKAALQKAFADAGIAPYWRIETFREYDFTKNLIQQLRSEKNLFSLLALIIIIVACSNIISMLIILVNDKKTEIGILRSMGATSGSIAAIFGTCGVIMGVLGSVIGILAAMVTLKNLQGLVDLLSRMQGYDMFNPMFYGETLPSELSFEAMSFVILTTGAISLIAGLVPAIKASMMRPSAILRSE